jgi:hypothetical protein
MAIVGLFLLLQVYLAIHHLFDPDEWLAMHGAWLMAQGQVPYRDYFEHHGPLFHLLLSVIFRGAGPEANPLVAVATIVTLRLWMVAWYGLALAVVWRLAERWRGSEIAWTATALLATHITYAEKMQEIRPDALFQVLWLGALIAFARVVGDVEDRRAWRSAGLCLGAALATSVKLLVTGPGLCLGLLAGFAWLRRREDWRPVAIGVGNLLVAAAVPLGLLAVWFAAHGALGLAWQYNFARNLGWVFHSPPWEYLGWVVIRNVAFFGLAVAALLGCRRQGLTPLDRSLWWWTVGTMAGVFLMPVVQRQEFLLFLPLLALFAADAMVTIVRSLDRLSGWGRQAAWLGPLVALIVMLVWDANPFRYVAGLPDSGAYVLGGRVWQWLTLALLCGVLLVRRRSVTAGLAVIACAAVPVAWAGSLGDAAGQLGTVARVMTVSSPTDKVLDGWSGLGVFRPHAQYYFFLHPEIRALLTEDAKARMVADLDRGALAPAVALFDYDLMQVSPQITPVLHRWYRPVDPVDRIVHVRRRKPLAMAAVTTHAAAAASALPIDRLRTLARDPATDAAAVVTPTLLMGDGLPAPMWHTPGNPSVVAAIWRSRRTWHLEVWLHSGFFAPMAKGAFAFPYNGSWISVAGQGRQDQAGNWVMGLDLERDEPLPPYFLVRPKSWMDWLAVGLPVAPGMKRVNGPAKAVPAGQWQLWPRQDDGSPASMRLAATVRPDDLLSLTAWLPIDKMHLPVDLPESQGSSPWHYVDPRLPPSAGIAYDLTGMEAHYLAKYSHVWQARPTWEPLVYKWTVGPAAAERPRRTAVKAKSGLTVAVP